MDFGDVKVPNVDMVSRPGIGSVYKATVSLDTLYKAAINAFVKYAPRVQRGLPSEEDHSDGYAELFPFTDSNITGKSGNVGINVSRAHMMAAKYLMSFDDRFDERLFETEVLWNIRPSDDGLTPTFDSSSRILSIPNECSVTVPDSGHRHYAFLEVGRWMRDPSLIPPNGIVYNPLDNKTLTAEQIEELLLAVNPRDAVIGAIMLKIYALSEEDEGRLFYEKNQEGKPVTRGQALRINPSATNSGRFVDDLTNNTDVFSALEVIKNKGAVSAASRKLTTTSTLDQACKEFSAKLGSLREDDEAGYNDLLQFVNKFFLEWGAHNPAFLPGAETKERVKARWVSLATQNIIILQLVKFALNFYFDCYERSEDWRTSHQWKAALAKWSGSVKERDVDGEIVERPFMARPFAGSDPTKVVPESVNPVKGNPGWFNRIFVEKTKPDGTVDYTINNTRDSRDQAYKYMIEVAAREDT